MCFHVECGMFFRTAILQNIYEQILLILLFFNFKLNCKNKYEICSSASREFGKLRWFAYQRATCYNVLYAPTCQRANVLCLVTCQCANRLCVPSHKVITCFLYKFGDLETKSYQFLQSKCSCYYQTKCDMIRNMVRKDRNNLNKC